MQVQSLVKSNKLKNLILTLMKFTFSWQVGPVTFIFNHFFISHFYCIQRILVIIQKLSVPWIFSLLIPLGDFALSFCSLQLYIFLKLYSPVCKDPGTSLRFYYTKVHFCIPRKRNMYNVFQTCFTTELFFYKASGRTGAPWNPLKNSSTMQMP